VSPLGIPVSEVAESMGSMSRGRADFIRVVPRCLYLVDASRLCYYIDGR
jgi:hypothetical protein